MSTFTSRRGAALALATAIVPVSLAFGASPAHASVGSNIVGIALANNYKTACATNSAGGTGFYSSCTGNGGRPENWCADFAKWVWAQAGVNVAGLTPAAGSFGRYNGGLHSTPHVGDAVVFAYDGAGYADHVAIVTEVGNGTIKTIGGNEGGQRGNFAATSRVRLDGPYSSALGYSSYMGQRISGYVSPIGGTDNAPAPTPAPAPVAKDVTNLFAIGSGGTVFNAGGDFASGAWSAFQQVPGNSGIEQISAVQIGAVVHLFVIGSDGTVYTADGDTTAGAWSPFQAIPGNSGIKKIAATAVGSTVHLFATGSDGTIYTADGNYATGSWSPFQQVPGNSGIQEIAATAVGSTVHLFATGSDGTVYTADGNYATGSWSPFQQVPGNSGIKKITAVSTGTTVRLFAIGSDERIYNANGDYAAGTWSTFQPLPGNSGIKKITANAVGNTVHLYAVGSDGTVYNANGDYATGSWSPFQQVPGNSGIQEISATSGT
ncbi:CHAP domain-containing protein [Kitasatospora sp. A2-31]|uniref:CHAP domain-containing protein n=1 Tax=Kitasatospora sp. A2-31 TaxID=2916414 RepID=UPI001EEF0A3D|nr:CHAP domain-containing protein [Kitasatospora sp. A2-31]MCG6500018.1 CHAP domain-containing protein [Kitasatospora sp. A2-31]